jgi:PAS domain S-box-containing protein
MTETERRQPVVLVVDDDATVRLVASTALKRGGFTVADAEDGPEAVSAFQRLQPDIVLLDVMMPGMDGFQTCQALRKLPAGQTTPVIMMTGLDDIESINRAYDAGATEFITKPVNWLILQHRLRYILRATVSADRLRRSEAKNRALLNAIPDLMLRVDKAGSVMEFKCAKDFDFDLPLREIIGKKVSEILPSEVSGQVEHHLEQALQTDTTQEFEHQLSMNGQNLNCETRIIISSEDREEALVIVRDITERRCLEAQLLHAQKMEAVGTLAGGIAHDFNNLLQAVQGYAELLLLKNTEANSGYQELQKILSAAKKGGELTRQMLTFSRKLESKRQPVDLNHVVGEVQKLLERTIPKMIELEVHLAEDLKTVNADFGQLEQVLLNLAVNAKDAMPDGGKLVIATQNTTRDIDYGNAQLRAGPGEYVLLSISDTGEGVDQKAMDHIFEPFFSTKDVGKGTGLGLSMVYGIVTNHEGYIDCCSKPGEGTVFKIYLPACEQIQSSAKEETPEAHYKQNATILIVDDEESIRDLGREALGRYGYTVLTAADGEEALEVYSHQKEQIDLIVLDLIMPGMGGVKCLERLLESDPNAKVLITSGYSPSDQKKNLIESGAIEYLSKPYLTSELLRVIGEVLAQSRHSTAVNATGHLPPLQLDRTLG